MAAIDLAKTETDYWKPVFAGYEWTKKWIAEERPDVIFLVYNDHASAFSMEMIPMVACGDSSVHRTPGCRAGRHHVGIKQL